MKFIYLLFMTASVIASCIFGFMIFSDNKEYDKIEEKIENYKETINVLKEKSEQLDKEIAEKKSEKEESEAELNRIMSMTVYQKKPTAFLTFDDGPNNNTDAILDILKENNIKATFFIIANQLEGNKKEQDRLKRIAEEGHTIATHSYSHDYSKIYSSKEAFFEDIDKSAAIIEEVCGIKPTMIRLPGGTASAKGFCKKYGTDTLFKEIMEELQARGFTNSDWNIDTRDWSQDSSVNSIVSSVSSGASARLKSQYKTALVLMHNKQKTVDSLQQSITALQNLGYTFEAMQPGGYTFLQTTG